MKAIGTKELSQDQLLENSGKRAHEEMHKELNAACARYSTQLAEARKDVLTVDGKSLRADLGGKSMSFDASLKRPITQ
ncbi:hypothetical protein [Vibrio anguillarum]|uniref:hypothetical protein n=1 Tax=Vibrio anguillarum TaxID=55601 RepID=UPI000407BA53|nr:hypothetical protein [Vibrio anguillarum]